MNNINKSKITPILRELSLKYGCMFNLTDTNPDAGHILDKKNTRHFFSYGTIDLNKSAPTEFAQNKALSSEVIKRTGINIPREQVIKNSTDLIRDIKDAINYIQLPAIIKPVHGAQGKNIYKITQIDEIDEICNQNTFDGDDLIIQQYIDVPHEVRIVLLDGEVIQAYKRDYVHIIGDSVKTIEKLIEEKNSKFKEGRRNTIIDKNDLQIQNILLNLKLSIFSILPNNYRVNLSYGRNLSRGGEYEFIENRLSQDLIRISKKISDATGLRLVGLDLFLADEAELIKTENQVTFIEYNASPDMENNFYYNDSYLEKLHSIYEKIFLSMIRL